MREFVFVSTGCRPLFILCHLRDVTRCSCYQRIFHSVRNSNQFYSQMPQKNLIPQSSVTCVRSLIRSRSQLSYGMAQSMIENPTIEASGDGYGGAKADGAKIEDIANDIRMLFSWSLISRFTSFFNDKIFFLVWVFFFSGFFSIVLLDIFFFVDLHFFFAELSSQMRARRFEGGALALNNRKLYFTLNSEGKMRHFFFIDCLCNDLFIKFGFRFVA
jgi:hypothetical protein